MQRIYLLAQAARDKADPEQWLADLFAAQSSVYERAVIIMAGKLGLGRNLAIPRVANYDQIVALVKVWQKELKPLPVPVQKQTFKHAQRRAREGFEDFKDRIKAEAKQRQAVSKARQKAEAELARIRTPKGHVTDYDDIVPMSDQARREVSEARAQEGKVYHGPRRIREAPQPSHKANAWPLHWRVA